MSVLFPTEEELNRIDEDLEPIRELVKIRIACEIYLLAYDIFKNALSSVEEKEKPPGFSDGQ